MAASERSGRTGRTANTSGYFSAENLFKSVFTAFDFLLDSEDSNPQGCKRDQEGDADFLSEGSSSFVAPREIKIPDVYDDPNLSIISDSSDEYSTDSEDDRTIDSDESDSSTEAPSVYKKYQEDYLQEYFEAKEGTSWDFENNVVRFPSSHQIPQGVEGVIVNRGRGRQSRRRQPPKRSHSAMPTNRLLQKRRRQKRKMRRQNRQREERQPQPDGRLKGQEVRHRSLVLSPPPLEKEQYKRKQVRSKSKTPRSNQSAPELGRARAGRARSKSRPRDSTRESTRESEVPEKRSKSERGPREIDVSEKRVKSERGRSKSRHKRMSSKEAATYAELIERARSKSRTKGRTNNKKVLRELQDVPPPKSEQPSYMFRGKRNKEKTINADIKPKPKQSRAKRDPPAPKYETVPDRKPPTGPRNRSKHNRTQTGGGGNSAHNRSTRGRRDSSKQSGRAGRDRSASRDRALHPSSSTTLSIQAVGSSESKRSRFWLFSRSRDSFSKER